MKKLIVMAMVLFSSVAEACPVHDTVMQYSLFDALVHGVFDGELTVKELRPYGDFGIGTYNNIDGEMVALDGKFYQARADGSVIEVKDEAKTPFATITFFDADTTLKTEVGANLDAVAKQIDEAIKKAPNDFYAIRIDGVFTSLKLRAPRTQKKPYPPLKDVLASQAVFELKGVEGTLVGFKSPSFARGVNVPGYHFHFISNDRKAGGHVLAVEVGQASIALDKSPDWVVKLPQNADFSAVDFSVDKSAETAAAVKGDAK